MQIYGIRGKFTLFWRMEADFQIIFENFFDRLYFSFGFFSQLFLLQILVLFHFNLCSFQLCHTLYSDIGVWLNVTEIEFN